MPIRTAITRVTGQGEQFVVDVCQWNPVTGEIMHQTVEEMRQLANDMLELSDMRMYEMNMRMLEAYGLAKYFEPGTWQQVVQVLDILAGRSDIAQVIQRWEAAIEENKELAATRQAAYDSYAAQCGCCAGDDGRIILCERHS